MNKTLELHNSGNGSYVKVFFNKKGLEKIKDTFKLINKDVKEIKILNSFKFSFLDFNKKVIKSKYNFYDYIIVENDSYYFCFTEEGNDEYVYTKSLNITSNE